MKKVRKKCAENFWICISYFTEEVNLLQRIRMIVQAVRHIAHTVYMEKIKKMLML